MAGILAPSCRCALSEQIAGTLHIDRRSQASTLVRSSACVCRRRNFFIFNTARARTFFLRFQIFWLGACFLKARAPNAEKEMGGKMKTQNKMRMTAAVVGLGAALLFAGTVRAQQEID